REPGRGQLTEQPNRVSLDPPPQLMVKGGEQVLGRRVPRPAQGGGQALQRSELVGELGADGESTQSSHEDGTLAKTGATIESGAPEIHPRMVGSNSLPPGRPGLM